MLKASAPMIILFCIDNTSPITRKATRPVGSCCVIMGLSLILLRAGTMIKYVMGRNKINQSANPKDKPYAGAYLSSILDVFVLFPLCNKTGNTIKMPIRLPAAKCNARPATIM